jgi:hypothetical protein
MILGERSLLLTWNLSSSWGLLAVENGTRAETFFVGF